jgi:uncharacterized protein (TIGR02147 family)
MQMNTSEAINIKEFMDYRSYLKSFFELKKSHNPNWSYGVWANKLGLKATSSLTKIITGEREPGPDITQKMVSFFNFNSVEGQYFNDLVRLSKIKDDPRLKMMLMERMGREHPDAHLHVMDDRSLEIISNWFGMTIREMVKLTDFVEDAEWIQKRLMYEISDHEINKTIKDLLHQGLITRDKAGKLKVSDGLLHTTNDVANEGIKKYHEQMLDNAKKALRLVAIEKREYNAETFVIDEKNLPEAKEFIRDFKSKFVRNFEEKEGSQVYQLQIQFFPLTE